MNIKEEIIILKQKGYNNSEIARILNIKTSHFRYSVNNHNQMINFKRKIKRALNNDIKYFFRKLLKEKLINDRGSSQEESHRLNNDNN